MGKFPLPIVYDDEFLMVLDKPVGMVVNDSETQKDSQTLQGLLFAFSKEFGMEEGLDRSGIVHRLDKETSGLILIAKSERILLGLQKQFKKRLVKKTYLAVVRGKVRDEKFKVDAPLSRNPNDAMKFGIVEGGRDAVTEFKRVGEKELAGQVYTLLEAYPSTGRTHQIRVHLAAYGNPIVGDVIYSHPTAAEHEYFGRMMLHAAKITFEHPISKKILSFESPAAERFSFSH